MGPPHPTFGTFVPNKTVFKASVNDDDEHPVDKVTFGGGERPLGEKLRDGFEVRCDTYKLTGAIELHRLVSEDYNQLLKRKDEITKTIIESTCSIRYSHRWSTHQYKEVSQPSLHLLLPPQVTPLSLACGLAGNVTKASVTTMHLWRL